MSDPEKSYLQAVMEDFFIKAESEKLYHYLNNPRPENIKLLALKLLTSEVNDRQLGEDFGILTKFLDFRSKEAYAPRTFEKLVTDIDNYDKYKRISVFIERYRDDNDRVTSMVNLDFIAWLIDFQPRPILNYRRTFYPDFYKNAKARASTGKGLRSASRVPKTITEFETRKEEFEALLANFNLPDFEKTLSALAKQQLELMLNDWKENDLIPLFEGLLEKRLLKLEKKIQRYRRWHRRLGFVSLLFIQKEDRFLFEEDLFNALEDYQFDVSIDGIDDSILESISELGNLN